MTYKRFLLIGICAMAAMAVGCNEEVNQLKSRNVSLSERLDDCRAECEKLRSQLDDSRTKLAGYEQGEGSRDQIIVQLQKRNAELVEREKMLVTALEKLAAEYKALAEAPVAGLGRSDRLPKKLSSALQKFAQANPDIAEYDAKLGMVKLKSDLTFSPGSAQVKPGATAMLAKLVTVLNDPAAGEFSVYVAGHTDDVPIGNPATRRRHATNWLLSAHRAVGVQKALTAASLDPSRIAVMGFGQYHPIVPNKPNKKGNAANRRVELWITPTGQFLSPGAE
jgi:chemotaxis protein MotB